MEIIPAIDIRDGRCVRLDQGDYSRETVFAADPAEVARRWRDAGAARIHVVDLDGAREGAPRNQGAIFGILEAVGRDVAAAASAGAEGESSDLHGGRGDLRVQVGGGLRDVATMGEYIDAGADRINLGTAAIKDQTTLANAVALFGDRVLVGVDARDGLVATEGWLETSEIRALDLISQLSELGVRRIFYTDISRDGMLGGPNFPAIQEVVEHAAGLPSPMSVIASGGVSSVEHLQRLKLIGVEGVIIGKALYTGDLDLREAIATVS